MGNLTWRQDSLYGAQGVSTISVQHENLPSTPSLTTAAMCIIITGGTAFPSRAHCCA